jgi:hypothetical protein
MRTGIRWRASTFSLALATAAAIAVPAVAWSAHRAIAEPQVIELNTGHCGGAGARCRFYPVRSEGKADGQIITVNGPVLDTGGTVVGRLRETCIYVGWSRSQCTQVFSLKGSDSIGRGSIVTTGILGAWIEGLNGIFAVTGGTGVYTNVRGQALKVWDGTDFIFTLHLTP